VKRAATATANANIALAKYWGKRAGDGNVPAVPSLSVTLGGLTTTTTVTFDDAFEDDAIAIEGATDAQARAALARARAMLDRVRAAAGISARARVASKNAFPTGSGLASSASGYAALALAASRAAGLDWDAARVADLARRSSASAARSLFGGFVEMDGGPGALGAARALAPASALDLRVLVCVTTEEAKATSSTDGMLKTQAESPYYAAWLEQAPRIFAAMREAVLAGDFARTGELAERSALAMHASAFAAGVVYVSDATIAALVTVRALRSEGLAAYATMDAGPHLKCLVPSGSVAAAKARLEATPGVLRVIVTEPGAAASIVAAPRATGGGASPGAGEPSGVASGAGR
jgi:diphosphomevalonate decarboxylase